MHLASQNSGRLGQWAKWEGNQYWISTDGLVALAFRTIGRVALVVTNPVGSPEYFEKALSEFKIYCDANNLTPAFYCVDSNIQTALPASHWKTIEIGKEAVVLAERFGRNTSTARLIRHSTSRAERAKCYAVVTTWAAMSNSQRSQVREILEERASQRRIPNIGFTVGTESAFYFDEVDLALAFDGHDRIIAVTSWHGVPFNGQVVGRTLETMSRSKASFNGVLDFLICFAIEHYRNQGVETVSLSGIPLLLSDPLQPGLYSRLKFKTLKILKKRFEPLYGFDGLRKFKLKFEPQLHPLFLISPQESGLFKIVTAIIWAYFRDSLPF